MSAGRGVQLARAKRAFFLVAAGLVLLALFGLKEVRAGESALDGEKASASLVLSAKEGGAAASVFDELSTYESELPAPFVEELFSAGDAEVVYVDEGETVFAFVTEGSADEEFGLLCAQMEDGGWRKTESGIGNCASFVKEDGVYRWAVVCCYDIGGKTTVVAQVQPSVG